MKLASTTGDFYGYTGSDKESLRLLREAGFRYADMNMGCGYAQRKGIYSDDCERYFEEVALAAEDIGIKMIQAHAPMGKPIVRGEDYEPFIEVNKRCIECCALLGIDRVVVHSGYEYGLTKEECFERNKEFYMR